MSLGKSALIFAGGMFAGVGLGIYEFLRFSAKNERIGAVVREEAQAAVKKAVTKVVKVVLTEKTVEPGIPLEELPPCDNEILHTVYFTSHKEAKSFLAYMQGMIYTFGDVNVAAEKAYTHTTIDKMDYAAGWTNLDNVFITPYKSGYKVIMPLPRYISRDTRK